MAFTKVLGPGIHTQANIHSHNINSSGIITATKFVGPITGGGGDFNAGIVTCTTLDVNGNADISGNLVVHGDTTTLNTTLREVELLHVDANSSVAAGIITQRGSGDILNLFDTTTEVFTVLDGGNIGIGTGVPGVKLEIKGTAATLLRLDSSNAQGTSFRIRNSGTDKMYMGLAGDFIVGQGSNVTDSAIRASGALLFASGGGTEHMRVAGGIVGIGTNKTVGQGAKLRVGTSFVSNTQDMSDGGILVVPTTGATIATGQVMPMLLAAGEGSSPGIVRAGIAAVSTSGRSAMDMVFCTRSAADGTTLDVTDDEKLRITSDGKVKITSALKDLLYLNSTHSDGLQVPFQASGTTFAYIGSAKTLFSVGSVTDLGFRAESGKNFCFGIGASEKMRITSAGKVGINSTSPTYALEVDGGTQNTVIAARSSDAKAAISFLDNTSGGYGRATIGGEGDEVYITSGAGIEAFRINSSGNLTLTGSTHNLFTSNSYNVLELRADENNDGGNDDCIFRFTHDGTFRSEMRYDESESTLEISTSDNRNDLSIDASGKVTFAQEIATPQDYPDFRPTVDWNFAAVKKLDPRITYSRTGPASYIDEYGILKLSAYNVPRFDHDPVTGKCKGLLIEPGRTNTKASSRDFSSGWNISGVVDYRGNNDTSIETPEGITDGVGVMPLIEGSGGSVHQFYVASTSQVSKYITYSVFAKPNGRNHIQHQDGPFVHDLVNGTTSGSATGEYISATTTKLANGWCRCTMTRNHSNSYDQFNLKLHNGSSTSYSGDGSSGVYIWGVQQEDGAFPTSYVPTDGTTRTRGADFAYLDGTIGTEFDDIYNATEGTFVIDWFNDPNGNHNDGYVFAVDDGTGNNRIAAVNSNGYQVTVVAGGTSQGTRDLGSINSGDNKIAFTYKNNDQATSLNGSDASVDTSSSVPSFTGSKYWWFGLRQGQYDLLGGYIKRIIYYPKRLSNNQLKTLTS